MNKIAFLFKLFLKYSARVQGAVKRAVEGLYKIGGGIVGRLPIVLSILLDLGCIVRVYHS